MIREQDPLKQGLKQINKSENIIDALIREQDPLKQGLKPLEEPFFCFPIGFASKIH